ncbi:hypothetical protein MJD09_27515 [bacterium]|nr:hypothetical protein [bacterium]
MITNEGGIAKLILSALLFPTLFQRAFLAFAWGAQDQAWMMFLKRTFLVLPVLAIILACWLTIACVLTALLRQNRQDFIRELFVTWWDIGKAVFSFWAGIFIFVFNLFVTILSVIKITALGIWSLIQEIVIMPFRLLAHISRNIVRSPVPWIAIVLTLFWCLIEAVIFTYVTSTLVVDTFCTASSWILLSRGLPSTLRTSTWGSWELWRSPRSFGLGFAPYLGFYSPHTERHSSWR